MDFVKVANFRAVRGGFAEKSRRVSKFWVLDPLYGIILMSGFGESGIRFKVSICYCKRFWNK